MNRLVVIQNISHEGPGLFADIAKERRMDIFNVKAYLGEALPDVDSSDIVLILGGPMGLNDLKSHKYPWLSLLVEYIKDCIDNQIPFLGVCLGAQLLAYAQGGGVEKLVNPKTFSPSPEVGWSYIFGLDICSKDTSLPRLEKPLRVLHWHGDRIKLPSHSTLIAKSNFCDEQMFAINNRTYGLQFHPEITEDMFVDWISNDRQFILNALGSNGLETLRSQQKMYCISSMIDRIEFISNLFNYIAND